MLFDRACEIKWNIFINSKPHLFHQVVTRVLVPSILSNFSFSSLDSYVWKLFITYKLVSHLYFVSNIETVDW